MHLHIKPFSPIIVYFNKQTSNIMHTFALYLQYFKNYKGELKLDVISQCS